MNQSDESKQAYHPATADQAPAKTLSGWMTRWQLVARRIRVPLGFVSAGLYLWELYGNSPRPGPMLASAALVLPGLWLRGYAAGYVKKNRELTMTGPYAYTRNPLYLGSILIAFGFAVALTSLVFAIVLIGGFLMIYVPVIASEEDFLRRTFPKYEEYCERVPRLIPRLTPAPSSLTTHVHETERGSFSFSLYCRHREYNSAMGALLLYASLEIARLLHGHGWR
uniref:Isoprenylcysteine carboxylmethyltransferase family protein n=1 Tax=mine drainage metagenome TaxID=410659 RepID=E6PYS0_9ZZZZ